MAEYCEHNNKSSGSIKIGDLLDQLKLLKKDLPEGFGFIIFVLNINHSYT
jgi:hypothetical protein